MSFVSFLCAVSVLAGTCLLIFLGWCLLTRRLTLAGDPTDAIDVELQKWLRIRTRYPVLFLFAVAAALVAVPVASFEEPELPAEPLPIKVGAHLSSTDQQQVVDVKMNVVPTDWHRFASLPFADGKVAKKLHRDFDSILVEVFAPSYSKILQPERRPDDWTLGPFRVDGDEVDIGFVLMEKLRDKPGEDRREIVNANGDLRNVPVNAFR